MFAFRRCPRIARPNTFHVEGVNNAFRRCPTVSVAAHTFNSVAAPMAMRASYTYPLMMGLLGASVFGAVCLSQPARAEYRSGEKKAPVKIVVTGAAGQIGYSILPLLASGQAFGPDQKIVLSLLEITPVLPALNGVKMELDDCAYPLVEDIICTDNAAEAFKDADYAVLIGGFPRKKGMLRKDLLAKNAPIFRSMGQALDRYAKKTCKVLVVANPANTNCLIAATNAPSIPKENFCAMTRLDYNRARHQIADKLETKTSEVKNLVIWGNHSATQVPDVTNATVEGLPAANFLDDFWLSEVFTPTVQGRGKAIIEARRFSSALSAANAAKDCLRDWEAGTQGESVAMAVYSKGEYGITPGIFYSFPVECEEGKYKVNETYQVTPEMKKLMKASERELLEEKREAGLV